MVPLFCGALLITAGAAAAEERKPGGREASAESARIILAAADVQSGIRGYAQDGATRIDFESRSFVGALASRITGRDGQLLWSYEEGVHGPGTSSVRILIGDTEFDGTYTPDVVAVIDRIAASPEGQLLRLLAFRIYRRAAGGELAAERRGLETAFQAMQQGYHQLGLAAETEDYVLSEKGGFAVKSQHRDGIFSHNYLAGDHAGADASAVRSKDDPHIGDDCFGMCGRGCSSFFSCGFEGWSHEWIGTPTDSFSGEPSCECSRKVDGGGCGDAYGLELHILTGTAVHTIRGRSSYGCIAHDWCCRNLGGCLDPLCIPVGVEALTECWIAGWPVSWSYVGPHLEVHIIPTGSPEWCSCEPCPTTERY